jgi:hypothetical protein
LRGSSWKGVRKMNIVRSIGVMICVRRGCGREKNRRRRQRR